MNLCDLRKSRDAYLRAEKDRRQQEADRRAQEDSKRREREREERQREREREQDRRWYQFEPDWEEIWTPDQRAEIDKSLGQRPGWYQGYWS